MTDTVLQNYYKQVMVQGKNLTDYHIDSGLGIKTKKPQEIDATCKFQMDAANFAKLKTALETIREAKKTKHGKDQTEGIKERNNKISVEYAKAVEQINNFAKLDALKDAISKNLTLKRDSNSNTEVKDASIKQIKLLKDNLQTTKTELDRLIGSLVSGGVFKDTEKAIAELKSYSLSEDSYLDLDLDGQIMGEIFTSSGTSLFGNKKIGTPISGKILSVNPKKKIYKIIDLANPTKEILISQGNICLVNNDKLSTASQPASQPVVV
jgi:hypothetical protein